MKTLVVIDNFDSFTFNLVQLLKSICNSRQVAIRVLRNNASLSDITSLSPCGILISPGPGGPHDCGVSRAVLEALDNKIPVLGVCLGHQLLASFYGGSVGRAATPVHGKSSLINHSGSGIFDGLPDQIEVGRYHSLVIVRENLPKCLRETAWTQQGELMGIEHVTLPRWGVQFHPESFLSEYGELVLENFVKAVMQESLCNSTNKPFSENSINTSFSQHAENFMRVYGEEDGFFSKTEWCNKNQDFITYSFLEPLTKVWSNVEGSFCDSQLQSRLKLSDNPLFLLDFVEQQLAENYDKKNEVPFAAGFLSYELLHCLEEIPEVQQQANNTPLALFYLYRTVIRTSSQGSQVFRAHSEQEPFWYVQEPETFLCTQHNNPSPQTVLLSLSEVAGKLKDFSNFSKKQYIDAVERIKEKIRDGQVYQVNLSQQFSIPLSVNARDVMIEARRSAAAPCQSAGTFIYNSKKSSFVSASPELFFRTEKDKDGLLRVSVEPIKGTRPRHHDPVIDDEFAKELLSSKKDHAELAMIVDLVRNDLGRVAETGSVVVATHGELRSFAHVHHLVSEVRGTLACSVSFCDLVKALFPCGSITGAPKIAAMETIAELEGVPRGIWTGAIGTITSDGSSHFNVAIRTALLDADKVVFNAGGGITIDSDPEDEYWETIAKSRALVSVIEQCIKES